MKSQRKITNTLGHILDTAVTKEAGRKGNQDRREGTPDALCLSPNAGCHQMSFSGTMSVFIPEYLLPCRTMQVKKLRTRSIVDA